MKTYQRVGSRAILTFACLFHAVFSTILRLPCLTQADFKIFEIGKRLKDNVMSKHRDTTDVQCTVLCVENTKCRSYNIHIAKLICELNSKAWNDNGTTLTDDAEWVYRSTDYNELHVGPVCKDLKPCDYGILCRDTCSPPYYECVHCDEQHTGLHCDIPREVNECQKNPCQNSGECVDKRVGYECKCGTGFTGRNCENYINGCDSLPCFNGGTCQNTTGSYICTCANGYVGVQCEDLHGCNRDPCQFYERCVTQGSNYTCVTLTNVALNKETNQSSFSDAYKAVDGNTNSRYRSGSCSHTDGTNDPWPWWEVDLGHTYHIKGVEITNRADCCANRLRNFNVTVDGNLCFHQSQALPGGASVKIPCSSLLYGRWLRIQLMENWSLTLCEVKVYAADHDQNECTSKPCQNGGTCVDYFERYSCKCKTGFTGSNCESSFP